MTVLGNLNAICGQLWDEINETDSVWATYSKDFEKYLKIYLIEWSSCPRAINTSGRKLIDLCTSSTIILVNGRPDIDTGNGNFSLCLILVKIDFNIYGKTCSIQNTVTNRWNK